jgi:hypothetical protein
MPTHEEVERAAVRFLRFSMFLLVVVGSLHSLWVLFTGTYDVFEYATSVRLEGWNARVGALIELIFMLVLGWWTLRADFDGEKGGAG